MVLGPALASVIAYQAAVASFPLGNKAGQHLVQFFPGRRFARLDRGATS
jgi:hypothetical protein